MTSQLNRSRTFAQGSMANEFYFRNLIAAYRRFFWILDPDFVSFNDVEAWDKIRKDARIAHAIQKRMQSVAGLDWQIISDTDDPQDKLCAKIIEEILKNIPKFHEVRRNLAEGIFRGSSWAYIHGSRRLWKFSDDTESRSWWIPSKIQHIDRYRIRLARDEQSESINTFWELGSVERGEWERINDMRPFIRHTVEETEQTLGYGRGLLQSIFFFWRSVSIAVSQGLVGLERWAQGILQISVDGLRRGDTDKNNDEIVNAWITQMEKQKSEHVIVSDKTDEIKVHDMPAQGARAIIEFIEMLYTALDRLILTSSMPTGGGSDTGSFAKAQVEERQMEATIQADRESLSETLDESLVELVWDRNRFLIRSVLESKGLPMGRRPKYRIMQKKFNDPARNIAVITSALSAGIPLIKREVYEAIEYTQPKEDDDVIQSLPQNIGTQVPPLGNIFPEFKAKGENGKHLNAHGRTPKALG